MIGKIRAMPLFVALCRVWMSAKGKKRARLASVDTSSLHSASVSSVGVVEGSGGGGAGDGGNYDSSESVYNPFAMNKNQKNQMVAGKTVMFDGEPIGVKGRDLFDMVHVVYERKSLNNQFIGGNGAARGAVRAPSSIVPARVIVPPKKKR